MVALPLFKLGTLVIKQAAKPIANLVKRGAKSSEVFRKIMVLPAQAYNRREQLWRMRNMGFKGHLDVKPLSEEAAVELAADMLGEIVVFGIAVGILYVESLRSQAKDQAKEDKQIDKIDSLEKQLTDLGIQVERQSAQIRELTRILPQANISTEKS